MSDETWDDAPCTDCGDTGITYQTERVCSCLAGLAIEMIDADACPSPTDRISSLESQLLAAERERDALREALRPFAMVAEHDIDNSEHDNDLYVGNGGRHNRAPSLYVRHFRAALTANHSAPVVDQD